MKHLSLSRPVAIAFGSMLVALGLTTIYFAVGIMRTSELFHSLFRNAEPFDPFWTIVAIVLSAAAVLAGLWIILFVRKAPRA